MAGKRYSQILVKVLVIVLLAAFTSYSRWSQDHQADVGKAPLQPVASSKKIEPAADHSWEAASERKKKNSTPRYVIQACEGKFEGETVLINGGDKGDTLVGTCEIIEDQLVAFITDYA